MDKLADVGVSVATEATCSLLANIKKHISYLIKYKENLNNLKGVGDRLDAKRTDASRFLDDTDTKFKDVSSTTTLWKSKADELHKKAQHIFSVNNVSCINMWSRYLLSKRAWELTQEINEHLDEAADFGTTFDRPTPELGATFNLKGFVDFESRLKVLNEVVEALKEAEVSMCSICGMGGAGKTTLAKKIIQRVESDHLFDKVAMVTVSQTPKLEVIQREIIEQLGLKMDEETTKARGIKLNSWLANNNALLILDDVWWQLSEEDFENVGIPLGSKMCKILLTSRNEDECKKTGSQRNFNIGVLEHKEAWDLFRLCAGKCVEDSNLQDTATKIARECDGLPIAIVTIATALKDNPVGVWNDSLRQLQNSNIERVSGEKVYSRIRLSYDLLKDNEAQSIFCLCCLFPEDFDIPVEQLLFFGKGLELFKNVDSISEARDRVEAIIHKLKKSFLLLDGTDDTFVKMHDVMRDFAISISSDSCLVRHGDEITKWHDTSRYENCSAVSFMFKKVKEFPVDLRCPKLKLLLWSVKNSDNPPIGFVEGKEELKVLFLDVWRLSRPLVLGALKELRTLIIVQEEYSNIWEKPLIQETEDLISYGNLKNLEILAVIQQSRMRCFPMEIGLLCNLRYLDFSDVSFEYMPPNVLSKLVKLEELLLPKLFKSWGCKEVDGERVNASLDEIESLPLTRLMIGMKRGSGLGKKLVHNLKRFYLSIEFCSLNYTKLDFECTIGLAYVDASIVTNWMIPLLLKVELLELFDVRNLKNLMLLPAGSSQLKEIYIFNCYEIECFFTTKVQAPRFNNLRHMNIRYCSNLKYLFPLSVATELRQLQHMDIGSCGEMEKIFSRDNRNQIVEIDVPRDDDDDDDPMTGKIVFPRLKKMALQINPKLRVIYDGNKAIDLPLLEEISILRCKNIEAFSYGSVNAPKLKQVDLDDTCYKDGVEDVNAFFKDKKLAREKLDRNEEINEEEKLKLVID